ncbi:MAG: hypothetical protein ACUVTD_07990 [Nitrososphaerales archaeon]
MKAKIYMFLYHDKGIKMKGWDGPDSLQECPKGMMKQEARFIYEWVVHVPHFSTLRAKRRVEG